MVVVVVAVSRKAVNCREPSDCGGPDADELVLDEVVVVVLEVVVVSGLVVVVCGGRVVVVCGGRVVVVLGSLTTGVVTLVFPKSHSSASSPSWASSRWWAPGWRRVGH